VNQAAEAALENLRASDRTDGEAMLRIYLGEAAMLRGDAEAEREFERGLSLSRRAGDDWTALTVELSRVNLYISDGRLDAAIEALPALRATAGAQGRSDAEISAWLLEGRCLARLGRAAEAEQAVFHARSLLSSERSRNRFYDLHLALTDGMAQSAAGRHAEAMRILDGAARDARETGLVVLELEARLALGTAELAAGRPEGVARLEALASEAEFRGAFRFVNEVRAVLHPGL
jgi:tetratricopeptide (TPR) repeat protein